MPQTLIPWNILEVEIPTHLKVDETEVNTIIANFDADGALPDITITETGTLIAGINSLEAAKRLQQEMIVAVVQGEEVKEDISVQWIDIDLIDPHPVNSKLYGEIEDVSALAESIAANGLQEPLTVTPNGSDRFTAIHGHRRRLACKELGMKSVPCFLKIFSTSDEAIASLLSGNEYREKTIEQKAREYQVWEVLERAKSKSRQGKAGQGEGTTRDILAKRVGLGSGVNAERAVKCVEAMDDSADALPTTFRGQLHQQLKQILSGTRGVDKAYRLIKPAPKQPEKPQWKPQVGDRVRIVSGSNQDKEGTVHTVLSDTVLCHIDGTPVEKRAAIAFTHLELINLVAPPTAQPVTSVEKETKQKQSELGLGSGEQVLPDVERTTVKPTEQLQASAVNLNVVPDVLPTEIAIALIKCSPKQIGEAIAKATPDLSPAQLEALWQAISKALPHKAA